MQPWRVSPPVAAGVAAAAAALHQAAGQRGAERGDLGGDLPTTLLHIRGGFRCLRPGRGGRWPVTAPESERLVSGVRQERFDRCPHRFHDAGIAVKQADRTLEQQREDLERTFPLLGPGISDLGVDDLECASQRDAHSTYDRRQPGFGLLAVGQVEHRSQRELLENGLELDLRVDALKTWMLSCRPLVMGRSNGSMMSRPFACAVAWPTMSRS